MTGDYLTKTNAVSYISMQTGYGRYIVERTLKQLEEEGKISFATGIDARALFISSEHVEYVINYLKRKVRQNAP